MPEFSKEDFQPLEKKQDVDQINRPSLSYWQDARIRFFQKQTGLRFGSGCGFLDSALFTWACDLAG